MSILETKGLMAGYGSLEVLHDVNLVAEDGEITGIIGPNGTGKSTLLKAIIGLADVMGGEIIYKGSPLVDVSPSELVRDGITYMPQGDRVFPDMTVADNLRMGGYILDRDQFEESVEQVYEMYPVLEEKRRQRARNLSGGQQTMLSFGMALVNTPDLILLDEPSAGLAPDLVAEMFERIQEIRDRGIPFLIVEQSVRVLLENCDHVYVIDEGETVFDGPPESIREREDLMDMYLALES